MRILTCFLSLFLFSFSSYSQQLSINEIMASNGIAYQDEDGDEEDWIEIYNYGEFPINLSGFSLSDDNDNLSKWVFPEFTLESRSYLVIWASGKDKKDPNSPLHTNFNIDADGEELFLSNASGEIIESLETPEIPTDYSYGKYPDGTGTWYFYKNTTQKNSNNSPGQTGLLAPPEFSHKAGWYQGPFDLTFDSPSDGEMILYTLDGSEPDIKNIDQKGEEYLINYFHFGLWGNPKNLPRKNKTYVYKSPIEIKSRTDQENDLSDIITTYFTGYGVSWKRPQKKVFKGQVIRAKVYRDGNESPTVSSTYLVHPKGENRFSLPIISISTSPNHLFGYQDGIYVQGKTYFDHGGTKDNYVYHGNYYSGGMDTEAPVHMEFFGEDGELKFAQNLGLRIHGGGSRAKPMKSFRLYARNIYDDENELDHNFFQDGTDFFGQPIPSAKHLLVRAGGDYIDIFSDAVCHEIMKPSAVITQRSRPSTLLINGEYWGVVNIRERLNDHHVSRLTQIDEDNLIILNAPWGEGDESQLDKGQPEDLLFYRELFQYAIEKDLSDPDHFQWIKERLDLLSYIDYNAMFIYLNNSDWRGQKHFRYWRARETTDQPYEDGKWRMMVWDFDVSARTWTGPTIDYLATFIHPEGKGELSPTGDPQKTALLRSLLKNEEFKNLFINRFSDHINSTFIPQRFEKLAHDTYDRLEPELQEHYERWNYHGVTSARLNEFIDFGQKRPNYVRNHLKNHFDIGESAKVKLEVSSPDHGHIKINTLEITPQTPGIYEAPYPWEGIYFQNVPIQLKAIPHRGFAFDHWVVGSERLETEEIRIKLKGRTNVTAIFRKKESPEEGLIHFFHFGKENIENDVPLQRISASYSKTGQNAQLTFQPAISPYPPASGTEGIMDRVNDPTPVNYREQGNNKQPYVNETMRGIRARNPLQIFREGKTYNASIVFNIPTTLHKGIKVSMAVSRTNNGPREIILEYAYQEDPEWTSQGLENSQIELQEDFQLVTFDFGGIPEAEDNPYFRVRIRFGGETNIMDKGNARFNNISVDGTPLEDNEIITDLPNDNPEELGPLLQNLYPSPSKDKINLTLSTSALNELRQIQIIGANGFIEKTIEDFDSQHLLIPINGLSNGLHIVRLLGRNQVETYRFLKH